MHLLKRFPVAPTNLRNLTHLIEISWTGRSALPGFKQLLHSLAHFWLAWDYPLLETWGPASPTYITFAFIPSPSECANCITILLSDPTLWPAYVWLAPRLQLCASAAWFAEYTCFHLYGVFSFWLTSIRSAPRSSTVMTGSPLVTMFTCVTLCWLPPHSALQK